MNLDFCHENMYILYMYIFICIYEYFIQLVKTRIIVIISHS